MRLSRGHHWLASYRMELDRKRDWIIHLFFFFKWTKLPKKPRLACVRGCERSWNLLISPGLQGEEERLSAKEGHSVQWPCYTWLSGEGPRRGPSASTLIPQSPHRPESWLLPEKNDREAEPGLSQQPGTGALCWGRRGNVCASCSFSTVPLSSQEVILPEMLGL